MLHTVASDDPKLFVLMKRFPMNWDNKRTT